MGKILHLIQPPFSLTQAQMYTSKGTEGELIRTKEVLSYTLSKLCQQPYHSIIENRTRRDLQTNLRKLNAPLAQNISVIVYTEKYLVKIIKILRLILMSLLKAHIAFYTS